MRHVSDQTEQIFLRLVSQTKTELVICEPSWDTFLCCHITFLMQHTTDVAVFSDVNKQDFCCLTCSDWYRFEQKQTTRPHFHLYCIWLNITSNTGANSSLISQSSSEAKGQQRKYKACAVHFLFALGSITLLDQKKSKKKAKQHPPGPTVKMMSVNC